MLTHLVVEPPKELAGPASNHYLVDVGIEGSAAAAFRRVTWGSEDVRWFHGDGARFFDSHSALMFWGIGSSSVAFSQPCLDLPPAAAGASKHAIADVTFSVATPCRPGR